MRDTCVTNRAQIFTQLKRIKSAEAYPLPQAFRLVEALSRDLAGRAVAVLGAKRLMHLSFSAFYDATSGCSMLFLAWDDHVRQFRELARDLAKRRNRDRILPKLGYDHAALQDRIEEVRPLLAPPFSAPGSAHTHAPLTRLAHRYACSAQLTRNSAR